MTPTEIPVDPQRLLAALAAIEDAALAVESLPDLEVRPGHVAGRRLVAQTVVIHGHPHVIHVVRITSAHPAYLTRPA